MFVSPDPRNTSHLHPGKPLALHFGLFLPPHPPSPNSRKDTKKRGVTINFVRKSTMDNQEAIQTSISFRDFPAHPSGPVRRKLYKPSADLQFDLEVGLHHILIFLRVAIRFLFLPFPLPATKRCSTGLLCKTVNLIKAHYFSSTYITSINRLLNPTKPFRFDLRWPGVQQKAMVMAKSMRPQNN
jgi:hypothetical protein